MLHANYITTVFFFFNFENNVGIKDPELPQLWPGTPYAVGRGANKGQK